RDFGPALGLVRALLAARKLPHHAALQDVLADRLSEHGIGEIDLAGALAFDGLDRDLHGSLPASGRRAFSRRRLRRGLLRCRRRRLGRLAQAGRIRRLLRPGALGRVLDDDVAAARTGHGTRHQQQALLVVGGDNLEVLRGDTLVAVVTGHLLAWEGAAGVLAGAGRGVAGGRDRHALARPGAGEVAIDP